MQVQPSNRHAMSKVVSIIGGGPGGFGAARALLAEGLKVQIFEGQKDLGGVWHYTGTGPLYRDLETNLSTELMMYKDTPFSGPPGYRPHQKVNEYVVNYSEGLKVPAQFSTTIANVKKQDDKWIISDTNGHKFASDFLVVATGHYNVPFFPSIPGLEQWKQRYPDSITHSRYFDNPDAYAGKTVVVVGNGASGVDIAIEILRKTAPVYISRRHSAPTDALFDNEDNVVLKSQITKVSPETREVHFDNGETLKADVLMFCTGYKYDFPFLDELSSTQKYPILHPRRVRLCNLYRRTFSIDDTSLAVIAMDKQIVPMPMAETQGTAIARVFGGRLFPPSQKEMLALEKELVEKKGDSGAYHGLGYPDDVDFMDSLLDWAETASPTSSTAHQSSQGEFVAERWSKEKRHLRQIAGKEKLKVFRRKITEANQLRTE